MHLHSEIAETSSDCYRLQVVWQFLTGLILNDLRWTRSLMQCTVSFFTTTFLSVRTPAFLYIYICVCVCVWKLKLHLHLWWNRAHLEEGIIAAAADGLFWQVLMQPTVTEFSAGVVQSHNNVSVPGLVYGTDWKTNQTAVNAGANKQDVDPSKRLIIIGRTKWK